MLACAFKECVFRGQSLTAPLERSSRRVL